ncbi:hypothetical protein HQ535_02915 [bacterium]|nr:hypothetical protein [bacterium]
MRRYLRRTRGSNEVNERTSGQPPSANGASSFHLIWDMPQVPLTEVSATLEILSLPRVRRLYFWALQVSFASDRRMQGGAHLGLQWNPQFPDSTAVNWGGYAPQHEGGALLRGSPSRLPSAKKDVNTRDFPWKAGHRYRLRVTKTDEAPTGFHGWRGIVTDLDGGEMTTVRDLYSAGDYLVAPMVWSEVFARCEHPPVSVRWSDLQAASTGGELIRPELVRVNYQSHHDGGCDNTSVGSDELGILQGTGVERQVPHGALLPVPGSS